MYHATTPSWRGGGTLRGIGAFATALLLAVLVSLLGVRSASALEPPHVPQDATTDVCAMCHRAHTASNDATWTAPAVSQDASGSALLIGAPVGAGDTLLCYSCHGVDTLGSTTDIQSAFSSASGHDLAPVSSEYGPKAKQCSSCHDSHGTARTLAGDPYPALLRSTSTTNPALVYYTGDTYCASCHVDRVQDRWDGLDVWRSTGHARDLSGPTSGTDIVCSVCHEPHGSDNPPNVVEALFPPAVPATVTISANDRTLCFACHQSVSATYRGVAVYQTSTFGLSEATVTVAGEWASAEETRTIGECQNCHAPMGSSDGLGGTVPKLAELAGRDLCDTCHSASSEVSQTAVDLAQFKFPSTEITKAEVAVAYDAERLGEVFDRLALYAQETTGTLPFGLVGPREYDLPGRSSDMSYGDVQGDGVPELVIADPTAKRLVFAAADQLAGVRLTTPLPNVDATPTLVAVGDIFVDGTARPEIAVVSRSDTPPFDSSLHLYRYQAGGLVSLGSVAVGTDATGLALGDLGGTDGVDIVVTSAGDDSLRIFTESSVTPGTLAAPDLIATGLDPRGPSIGNADGSSAGNEIALALAGATTGNLRVYSSAGVVIGSYDATVAAGAYAWDTAIADVLPGTPGLETIVAIRNTTGDSGVNVFADTVGSGVGDRLSYTTGAYFATSSLAAGDVDSDADGDVELAVANAGTWAVDTTTRRAPSVQVFRSNTAGDALLAPVTYTSGGVEMAGNTPAIVVGDLRAVGRTRHPTSVVVGAHVSTETAPFTRHVECTDCHNVHEATSTVAAAPLVYGRLKGAWGVGLDDYDYVFLEGVVNEYEVCFKCHSSYDTTQIAIGAAGDVRSQIDTRNASFHPVMGDSVNASNTTGSFEIGWSATSRVYCKDCHGNSAATEPQGPHASNAAPLLSRPLWGQSPENATTLCYTCHKKSVYYDGVDAQISNFYDVNLPGEKRLHYRHVNQAGMRCDSCHASHGAIDHHLIDPELDWVHAATGGACYTPCHGGSTGYAYSRVNTTADATAIVTNFGDTVSTLADVVTSDGADYAVQELSGGYPTLQVDLDFAGLVGTPSSLRIDGRYAADSGHNVRVYAWNFATSVWADLGRLPESAADQVFSYPLPAPQSDYVSGGLTQIRIDHLADGINSHWLYVDRAWLQY
ncbi:MAG: cytochrome c3 family protein [Coriobacteriia bacterium]